MSEQAAESPAGEQESQEGAEQSPKVFDAEYVDKLRKESAKYRTEAKANAEAAKRLDEIEEANKTEAQKAAERLAAAEQDAASARSEALRLRVAAKFGISDEDADLFLTGNDEATLTKQAERLAGRVADRKKNGNHVAREGTHTAVKADDEREAARQLFGTGG